MRTLALTATLATALAGTGCIVTTDQPTGSVDLYWQFVRTTWDNQTLTYDPEASAPAGTGFCPESGVDTVDVRWAGGTLVTLDCRRAGVQGVALDGVPAGLVRFTLTGYRGSQALYRSSIDVNVLEGTPATAVSTVADVYGIPADLDVWFRFADAGGLIPGATCFSEGVDYFTFSVIDSANTTVASTTMFAGGRVPCSDSTVYPGVALDQLDLDTYAIRARAFRVGTAAPIYDSCNTSPNTSAVFDHFGADIGVAGGWQVRVLYAACP